MRLPVCFPTHHVTSGKGSVLKGKNLLPVGANSFLLEQTPFQKQKNKFYRGTSSERVCISLNYFPN